MPRTNNCVSINNPCFFSFFCFAFSSTHHGLIATYRKACQLISSSVDIIKAIVYSIQFGSCFMLQLDFPELSRTNIKIYTENVASIDINIFQCCEYYLRSE